MKKFHQFTQIALLIFFVAYLIFFMAFETVGGMFGMDEITSESMVKILLAGFVLFLLSWAISYFAMKKQTELLAKKEAEMNQLKAKLYDLEHPSIPTAPKKPSPSKGPDSDPTNLPPRQNIT
ncbi:hypothetical protein JYB64_19135 [Algoriphagus aestuarii]|nr:hypothetical protein [Algoriphagus aestuarii]